MSNEFEDFMNEILNSEFDTRSYEEQALQGAFDLPSIVAIGILAGIDMAKHYFTVEQNQDPHDINAVEFLQKAEEYAQEFTTKLAGLAGLSKEDIGG